MKDGVSELNKDVVEVMYNNIIENNNLDNSKYFSNDKNNKDVKVRIILTGCHNTGKTTFSKYLYDTYQFKYIYEGAREIMKSFDFNWKSNIDKNRYKNLMLQSLLVIWQKYKKMYFYKQFDKVVMDRSIIDIMAYSDFAYIYSSYKDDIVKDIYNCIIKMADELIEEEKKHTTLYIFCRNLRDKDSFLDTFIDRKIDEYIHKYNIEYFETYKFPMDDKDLMHKIYILLHNN